MGARVIREDVTYLGFHIAQSRVRLHPDKQLGIEMYLHRGLVMEEVDSAAPIHLVNDPVFH